MVWASVWNFYMMAYHARLRICFPVELQVVAAGCALLSASRGTSPRHTAATYPPSILLMYLSTQDASRPTSTDLYYMARTTTIECWAVKMRLRLTVLVLPAGMSGQSGALKHSHRMSFSSFPGRLRVDTAVGMRVDGNHLHR